MKLAILGASGPSGKYLVGQALDDGHHVVALVRNPQKITIKHENLQVRQPNIFSDEALTEEFQGCDAVLSCLGANPFVFGPVTLCQDAIKATVIAMRNCNVKKLIIMSNTCLKASSSNPFFMEWIVKTLIAKKMFADKAAMEDYLVESCQDLEFTTVKPPFLTNSPMSDEELVVLEADYSPLYKSAVPRPNVTRFMLDCLTTDTWARKLVVFGLKK